MTYKWTPLNGTSLLLLLVQLGMGYIMYDDLMQGEGWGMAGLIALTLITVLALLLDFILQLFLKNRWLLIRIEWVFAIFLVYQFVTFF